MPDAALQITPVYDRAVVRLRVWTDTQQTSRISPALGEHVRILSFSPGEWFAVSDTLDGRKLAERLRVEARESGVAIVDLSCSMKAVRLQGTSVAEVLSKGCGLDFDIRARPVGQCIRTRFSQIPVVIDFVEPPQRYELYVDASYLAYLQGCLQDASR